MGSFNYLTFSDSTGILPSLLRLGFLWCYSVWTELPITKTQPFRLTLRRIFILFVLAITLSALVVWNHVGFWLDDIFYPLWKETKVENPVFLVGNARSGTTWLHRLLSECKSEPSSSSSKSKNGGYSFTTFRTWEILFAVPVTWKVWFHALYALDQFLFWGTVYRTIMSIEHRLVGHISVHPIGLMEAEEDEWLMMHIGLAQLLFFFFPAASDVGSPLIMYDFHPDMMPDIMDALNPGIKLSDGIAGYQKKMLKFDRRKLLPLSTRLMIFEYYHACVQRHLYFKQLVQSAHDYQTATLACATVFLPFRRSETSGPASVPSVSKKTFIFVSKNPAFTLRLESLCATFPSAKVVCLLRDPVQSVPSMVSYISMVWHAFSSPTMLYPEARRLLGFCEAHYLYPLMHLHTSVRQKSSFAFVSYHRLIRDLALVVNRDLLPRLFADWKENSSSTQYLLREQDKTARFSSSHDYNFASCCQGLSVAELQRTLHAVYRVHHGYFPSQPMQ